MNILFIKTKFIQKVSIKAISILSFSLSLILMATTASGDIKRIPADISRSNNQPYSPKIHAIIIGIDEYKNPELKLFFATNDATAVYNVINQQIDGLYEKGDIYLLNKATNTDKTSIINAFSQIQKQAKPEDMFVFYASGMGINYPNAGYYLLTSDVSSTSEEQVKKDSISAENLQDLLAPIQANKKLILLESSHSGAAINSLERTTVESSMVIITASDAHQNSIDIGKYEHGLFTQVLLQAFADGDKNRDGVLDTNELSIYIEDKMPTIAKNEFELPLYPSVSRVGLEFKVVNIN